MQKYFFIIFLSFILMVPAFSAGGDGNSEKSSGSNLGVKKLDNYEFAVRKINKAKKLEKKGKTVKAAKNYQKALDYLLKANAEKPANPDILNYLGFSNRKLGNYDDAEIYYLLGLEINPMHIGINEYLGELYVETNRIVKAEERLNVLKNCNCEEYVELKEIIDGANRSTY